ncbi:MAG: acetylornithine transaminase [Rickettsiales bacterium]|jgi:acetylornithine/N-succinyldiaminopimelate aminotransferase|nr:acetylornithine transaminase [Rickettsiales bacterium]
MSVAKFNRIKKDTHQYIADTYARQDLDLSWGLGSLAYDCRGREYVDFTTGIGCNSLGIANPKIEEAVAAQVGGLTHTSNIFYNEPAAKLAKNLCEKTGYSKVFFSNSGAEANECAIKAARAYFHDANMPKYRKARNERRFEPGYILTLNGSFHGRTMATISMTGQDKFHPVKFAPYLHKINSVAVDFNEVDDFVDYNRVAAIVVEPVQGEGGVVPMTKKFMRDVRKLCDDNKILLIADEVQTGNGRTGTYFAAEQYEIKPDITTTAKGLGGGLAIGATLFNKKTAAALKPGDHGSTFGGNPLACAAANVVVEAMTPEFLDDVANKGRYMRLHLNKIPNIKDVSGMGLMLGAGLENGISAAAVQKECLAEGLLILTAGGNRLRFLPALNIPNEVMLKGINILRNVLTK